jgi:hypothetical protein
VQLFPCNTWQLLMSLLYSDGGRDMGTQNATKDRPWLHLDLTKFIKMALLTGLPFHRVARR